MAITSTPSWLPPGTATGTGNNARYSYGVQGSVSQAIPLDASSQDTQDRWTFTSAGTQNTPRRPYRVANATGANTGGGGCCACLLAIVGVVAGCAAFAAMLAATQPAWKAYVGMQEIEAKVAVVSESLMTATWAMVPGIANVEGAKRKAKVATDSELAEFQMKVLDFLDATEARNSASNDLNGEDNGAKDEVEVEVEAPASSGETYSGDNTLEPDEVDPLSLVARDSRARERRRSRAFRKAISRETNLTRSEASAAQRRRRHGVTLSDKAAMGKWDGYESIASQKKLAKKAFKGKACTSNAVCKGRQLCVRSKPGNSLGVCQCPVLYSGGTPGLCNARPKELPSWCPLHYLSAELTRVAAKKGEGLLGERLVESGSADLPNRADWSTCAVVGSGPSLRTSNFGADIDRHTAVIRFNEAPVEGFASLVGSKTTIRVQNIDHCGYSEAKAGELCLQYSSTPTHRCKQIWWKRGSCKVVHPSKRMERYVHWHWGLARLAKSTNERDSKKLSAGFFGVALALHLCGKVSLYGFGQTEGHYFGKERKNKGTMQSKRSFNARHSWHHERRCFDVLRRSGLEQVDIYN